MFAHLDHLRALLPGVPRVTGLADSGFYMDLDIFTPLKAFAVRPEGQNGTAFLSPWCRVA